MIGATRLSLAYRPLVDQSWARPSKGQRARIKLMASPKTLYWITLGVLAISFGSSNMGRNLACKASTVVDHLAIRTMPYVATVEMALGRTQAGYAHLQAHTARVHADQARLPAAMASQECQDVSMNRDRLSIF